MMCRLQKIIATRGYCSRRKAEELITQGRVVVAGVVAELGQSYEENVDIKIDDTLLTESSETYRYFLFDKPLGILSTVKDDRGRRTVMDFFQDIEERIYPVGRLDYNTGGLLILTNDGEFANLLMHPSSELPKTYRVKISGHLADDEIVKLQNGILIEDVLTYPATIDIKRIEKEFSVLDITIHEGRNREVRKMMEYFDHDVLGLERIKISFLSKGDLKRGMYRELTFEEVTELKNVCINNRRHY